ncbi:PTS sugar transporter subunit IIB [Anaerorhabdus furcosa]|uniref:PTS system, cellobiose-specific IIB component n=1 Tax=Anaerorhabdus furcosa TaxID=118967 RepID=A0A1T4K8H6_9FIRM|nr:PTS sugar transporter subunit IIB [Anaerorhabdus furcosa]SJZ38623.1 PTS system, cellobiose-specific IIB component [Anaerorhabdus furcosa]
MKICLICCAGMSTSAIVKKMQDAATEQNIDAEIWAVGEAQAKENVAIADVILIGPQIRFALSRIQALDPNKPVATIDMASYGRMDGKKILADAIALIK